MPNVTELATSQLNHSPHDVIRIELVEDLDIPAPIREPARIIVKWPQRTTMCEPRQFPEIAATAVRLRLRGRVAIYVAGDIFGSAIVAGSTE